MDRHPGELKIKDFTYTLPEARIAHFPLPDRASSRLLLYRSAEIQDRTFRDLPGLLPAGSCLVFNNTRVVQARLFFKRATGSTIEIFCLEPMAPATEMQAAMSQTHSCTWKCLVGNAKRWKEPLLTLNLPEGKGFLKAEMQERLDDSYAVRFSWEPESLTFAEILEKAGNLPLPPYLNRAATDKDKESYQTVYAQQEGAVAAPTAGLHFTREILAQLAAQQTKMVEVTLHVGAGTFRPVKAEEMANHSMHGEEIYVHLEAIRVLKESNGPLIPVGTTSLRTLESLYWLAVQIKSGKARANESLSVSQWLPYENNPVMTRAEALQVLEDFLSQHGWDQLRANTQLLIAPGYQFRMVQGLVTNFHQPESTLLLLVSALIGDDWRRVYQHALKEGYRFLSYGDSSLLLP